MVSGARAGAETDDSPRIAVPSPGPWRFACGRAAGAQRAAVPSWETAFAFVALFASTSPVISVLRQGQTLNTTDTADPIMQVMWSLLYVVVFCLVIKLWRDVRRLANVNWPLTMLLAMAVLSVLWSSAPASTAQRSTALVGTTALGVYLALRYPPPRFLRLLALALACSAVLSIGFAVLLPRYGIAYDTRGGSPWRGVYTTKGQLGQYMTAAALIWYLYSRHASGRRAVNVVMFIVSTALVYLTESKTCLVVVILLSGALPLIVRLMRWHPSVAVPATMALVGGCSAAMAWIWLHLDAVTTSLGRDVTLTGRTALWSQVWRMINRRPLLGYGYDGFWHGWDGPSREVWLAVGWQPPHAHNGYLDLWLQLGLIGIVLLALLLIWTLIRATRLARAHPTPSAEFPLFYTIFIIMINITGANLVARNSFYWVVFVVISCQLIVYRRKDQWRSQYHYRVEDWLRPEVGLKSISDSHEGLGLRS